VIERLHSILEMHITTSLEGQKLPMPSMQALQPDQYSHASYCSSSCSNFLNRDPPVKVIHRDGRRTRFWMVSYNLDFKSTYLSQTTIQ
jgi:hypothetical protein